MSKKEDLKEKCPACKKSDFAIASDPKQARLCKCGNVWLPLSLTELKLQAALEENVQLKARLKKFESLSAKDEKQLFE